MACHLSWGPGNNKISGYPSPVSLIKLLQTHQKHYMFFFSPRSTFLALSAAIRRAGGVRGVVGHVPGAAVSPSPSAASFPRRRQRAPGPAPECGRDAAPAGAFLHRRRRRRRGEPHAEQPHPSAAARAGGAGARVVTVVAVVRALPRHPLRLRPGGGGSRTC